MARNLPPQSDRRESGIVQRMRNSVRQLSVESPRVLLACSGGEDSVALAWLLAELRRLNLLTFTIAHIHHGQHDRADLAVDAVREIGKMLDVPVDVHRLQQQNIDAHGRVGLEEAMRRERYLALARIALGQKSDCIALAHHQADQAETLLLHLVRGAGIDGLAGMRDWERRRIPWWDQSPDALETAVWRPLINEPANDVAQLAAESGLPIVEDPTNSDPAYRRNAIRHHILPALEEIYAGATGAIARSAGVIAEDADLLEDLTTQALTKCIVENQLSREHLIELPEALQKRVVRQWVLDKLSMHELSADRIQAIVDLARRNRGGSVIEIGSGHSVTLHAGKLRLD